MKVGKASKKPAGVKSRAESSERVRENILGVALQEFSSKGLSGARVDEIAEKTQTSKRMIYYHFESKEGLYKAVLERAYSSIRSLESQMDLEAEEPEAALRRICEFTFDYHSQHPQFIRMVMNENILCGEYIGQLDSVRPRNRAIVKLLGRILDRGVDRGVFRHEIDPINLHMSISALCFFNVSNKYTFSKIFAWDMDSPDAQAERREIVADTILRWCAA
jgi:AcrR family transcriptional regulator